MLDNEFYGAAKETQNFLSYTSVLMGAPLWFIIPIPINLTMLGEYAVNTGFYTNYTISGNKIELEYMMSFATYILIYNSDGVLTRHVTEIFGVTASIIVLGEGKGDAITYGYYFLIFTLIGTMALVYLEIRKTK